MTYTFGVHFKDGSEYFQTPEDVSERGPQFGSAFSDIKDRLDDVELFQLEGNGQALLVDLRDGHFELNGLPLTVGDPDITIPPNVSRRLIYFRRVSQNRHFGVRYLGQDLDGNPIYGEGDGTQYTTDVQFHIGWQATVDGKNYKVTVAVDG